MSVPRPHDLAPWIAHLRAGLVPQHARVVSGAGSVALVLDRTQLVPAVWVLPARSEAGRDLVAGEGGVHQRHVEYVGVVYAVRVANDPTGELAADALTVLRGAVHDLVVPASPAAGWRPGPEYDLVEAVDGSVIGLKQPAGAALIWVDRFRTGYYR